MEEATRKWLTGCGIGCIALLVLGSLLAVGGYLGVKRMIHAAAETQVGMEAVVERFGRASAFTPAADGRLTPERIEAFLRVRQLCRGERGGLEASLVQLTAGGSSAEPAPAPGNIARSIRAAFGFMPQMMAYINARNDAFLEAGMGLGEYLYLYTVIYESWLEKPADDGPPFVLVGGEVDSADWSSIEVRERRGAEIRGRLNRTTLPILRNQLAALTAAGPPAHAEWAESLRTEILLMESDGLRLPWQDGLPPQTAASLEPFLEALDRSYSAMCHPVELAVTQQ